MPKPRRTNQQGRKNARGIRGTGRADSQASDDDDVASEVLSHYSSTSETASVAEEGTVSESVDEQSLQEEGEDKLRECIDNVTDKSSKTRQTALESLRLALSSRILYDVLVDRRLTLTDALERCLKKGKGEEQSLAASVLTLLCLQMGSGPEGEEVFRSLKPLLISILTDTSASSVARQSSASALAMCCYLVAADVEDLSTCLACLEGIFSSSYVNAASPITVQHNTQLQLLHCSALHAWALLLTICPNSQVERSLLNHLPKLPGLLSCENVNLRIVAGETIALLFELARELEDDFYYEETDLLCAKLKALATDSNKYRAKLDRRKQRSIFRDVLHFIENGECHEETIKFGLECMYVDSWVRRRTYTAFKEVLGSGVRHHLQNNELLRDVLELGPPILMDAAAIKASKITRVEKHMYNSAAFKARTKVRSKLRDKRADIM